MKQAQITILIPDSHTDYLRKSVALKDYQALLQYEILGISFTDVMEDK